MNEPGILEFLLSGKYLPAVGVALIAIVGLLRLALATKVPWFATKFGGYVLGYGSAFTLYVGEALRTGASITVGLLLTAFAAGWTAGGGWEFFRDLVTTIGRAKPSSDPESLPAVPPISPALQARAGVLMVLFALGVSACGGSAGEPGKPGQTIIDCTRLNAEKLGDLQLELLPLIGGQSPDWASVETKAVSAGVELGGCVLAELVQGFLGGRKAVPVDESWKAHQTLERFRDQHAGGATFRTARGDL